MHMTFWWGYQLSNYLFKGFSTHSILGLFGVCLMVFTLSFIFEFLRYLQAKHRQSELILRSKQLRTICPNESSNLLEQAGPSTREDVVVVTQKDRVLLMGADMGLWFVVQNLGYVLMLSVMVYNVWLFVAAVLGGGFGYFMFGQMFMKINLQNCHIMRETWCMQNCGEGENCPSSRDGESTPALESCDNVVQETEVHIGCHT